MSTHEVFAKSDPKWGVPSCYLLHSAEWPAMCMFVVHCKSKRKPRFMCTTWDCDWLQYLLPVPYDFDLNWLAELPVYTTQCQFYLARVQGLSGIESFDHNIKQKWIFCNTGVKVHFCQLSYKISYLHDFMVMILWLYNFILFSDIPMHPLLKVPRTA